MNLVRGEIFKGKGMGGEEKKRNEMEGGEERKKVVSSQDEHVPDHLPNSCSADRSSRCRDSQLPHFPGGCPIDYVYCLLQHHPVHEGPDSSLTLSLPDEREPINPRGVGLR